MSKPAARAIPAPIFAILLAATCQLFARSWLQNELQASGLAPLAARDLSYLLTVPLLALLLGPIIWRQRGFLAAQFSTTSLTIATVGIAIGIGLLLRLAFWGQLIGFVALGVYTNDEPVALTGAAFRFSCPPLATVVQYLTVAALLVPLIEEVIYRGFFLYGLLSRGPVVAIVASSALFALFHPPASMPTVFVIGLVFAVMALRSQILWPGMIAHTTYNAMIAVDWYCLRGEWNPDLSNGPNVALGTLALAVCCSALALILWIVNGKALAPSAAASAPPP